MLPAWLPTGLSPLTYFSRAVRAVTATGGGSAGAPLVDLSILLLAAMVVFALGAWALPRTD
jgi:ABC-2 type transport system permease protein